jgi:hypothetical protein
LKDLKDNQWEIEERRIRQNCRHDIMWLNLCLSADRLRYSVKPIVRLDAIEAAIQAFSA